MAKKVSAVLAEPAAPVQVNEVKSRMSTQEKNKTAHPGGPDMPGWDADHPERIPLPPSQRREEAAAAKAVEVAANTCKTAKRNAAVLKAAQIEARKRQEDCVTDEARRQPTRPKPRPRHVKRPDPPKGSECESIIKAHYLASLLTLSSLTANHESASTMDQGASTSRTNNRLAVPTATNANTKAVEATDGNDGIDHHLDRMVVDEASGKLIFVSAY